MLSLIHTTTDDGRKAEYGTGQTILTETKNYLKSIFSEIIVRT